MPAAQGSEGEAEDASLGTDADDPILPPDQWPSFDCDVELDEVELFICTDWQAAQSDRAFGVFWSDYLAERADHLLLPELQAIQTDWLELRATCLDSEVRESFRNTCLRRLYVERENLLTYAELRPSSVSAGDGQAVGWGPFVGTFDIGEDSPDGLAQPAIDAVRDYVEADLQYSFQRLGQFEFHHGFLHVGVVPTHGQRLSAFDVGEDALITPGAHPYFRFREFLYDREQQEFIEMSELFRPDSADQVATVLYEALLEAGEKTQDDYLQALSVDELGFFPVFDDAGLIVGFENSAQAESLGGYAGRICFYGLRMSAARVVEFANDEYGQLFAPNLVDGPIDLSNCR